MAEKKLPRTTLADNPQELELKLMLMGFAKITVHPDLSVSAYLTHTKPLGRVPVVFRELEGYYTPADSILHFIGHLELGSRIFKDCSIEKIRSASCTGGQGDLTGCPLINEIVLGDCTLSSLEGVNMQELRKLDIRGGSLGSLQGLPLTFPGQVHFEVDHRTKLGSLLGAPILRFKAPAGTVDMAFKFPAGQDQDLVGTREKYNRAARLLFSMPESQVPVWAADPMHPLLQVWAAMRLQDFEGCNAVFKQLEKDGAYES